MKKILLITFVVLTGIFSVNAQSYTVSTTWTATSNWPTPLDQSTDGYGVWITIYDVTNDVIVVNNLGSGFLYNTTLSYVFDVSDDMEPYIAGLSGSADFRIYCAVRAGNEVTLDVYDQGHSTSPIYTSNDFVIGQVDASYVYL